MKFNQPSIDSFLAFIPESCIGYLPERIKDFYMTVHTGNGEVLNIERIPVNESLYGVHTKISVANRFGMDGLKMTFNSKQFFLGDDPLDPRTPSEWYFEGITSSSFPILFRKVMGFHGIGCSYERFLEEGRISDVDLKADFFMDDLNFDFHVKDYSKIPSARTFSQSDNFMDGSYFTGVQFVTRKDGSITHPFVKLYTKKAELSKRSVEFANAYLDDLSIPDGYRRIEATIRNTNHYRSFKDSLTLVQETEPMNPRNILSLSKNQIIHIIKSMYERHTKFDNFGLTGELPRRKELSPTDLALGYMAYHIVKESTKGTMKHYSRVGLKTLLSEVTSNIGDPSSKTRVRKKIKKAFLHFIENQDEVKVYKNDLFMMFENS